MAQGFVGHNFQGPQANILNAYKGPQRNAQPQGHQVQP